MDKNIHTLITESNRVIQNDDITKSEKTFKTHSYTLNAIRKYREKNVDKIKDYNKKYNQRKKEELKKQNPYIDYTKQQLYDKIFELEIKIKELTQ